MHFVSKFFLSVCIVLTVSWSADVNATLMKISSSDFAKLLKKLPDANLSAEQALEKTLLVKLSKPLSKIPEAILPSSLQDEDHYRKLFLQYLHDINAIDELAEKLEKSKVKAADIQKRIEQPAKKDATLFSMQLQNVFIHRNITRYKQEIRVRNKERKALEKIFEAHLGDISYKRDNIAERLHIYSRLAQKYRDILTKLKIEQEQMSVLHNTEKSERVGDKIVDMQHAFLSVLDDLLTERFLQFSAALSRKDDRAFEISKAIRSQISEMNMLSSSRIYNDLLPLLVNLQNRYMGHFQTMTHAGKEEAKKVIMTTWEYINKPLFSTEDAPISIFKIIMTMIIVVLGFVIAGFYQRKINALTLHQRTLTQYTRTMLANLGYYIIIVFALFVALDVLGLKLSSLALVAGALSVGIGFGLKNIVSNFVSGLILMFERSIKIGDYVQLTENNLQGHVTDIRMRSTTINTNDNIDIIVPNQDFIQHNVINWTMNDKIRRFEVPFSVKYGTDAEKVIGVILKAVNQSGFNDIYSSGERHTRVLMTGMGDSSVDFELQVWIKGNNILFPPRTVSRFLILIYQALNQNGIEIPFPQRDLHIRSIDIPETKKESKEEDV